MRDWEVEPVGLNPPERVKVDPCSREAEAEAVTDGVSAGERVGTALEAVGRAEALLQRVGAATEAEKSAEALLQALCREVAVPVPVEHGE